MSVEKCPVNTALVELRADIAAGRFAHPRARRIGEEILELLFDIASGRAGKEHLPALYELADELIGEKIDPAAATIAERIKTGLLNNEEIFVSHIRTHNCSSGDCLKLAPAPCQMTCPAGLDIPTYLTLSAMDREAEAIDVIRRDCPFPWVCGLVCTRPCEYMCVRGRIDTPISIKSIKAYAAERAMSISEYKNPAQLPPKNQKVCVIGAGPGGMSAAYYLALRGYSVRVIEQQEVAGGMLLLGIPRYRLPREIIDREVAMIEDLGVEFQFNKSFGQDVNFEDLKAEGFEAFFVAIGAHKSWNLNIPGENDSPQVWEAIEFLRRVALGDRKVPGRRVIVIGGGNVAIDAARTCLRLGSSEVTIAYRRTRAEMPADVEEIEQAEEEGIRMAFLTVPIEVVHHEGRLEGLNCLRAELVKMEGQNRMYPKPIEGSDYLMPADVIISAIGQRVDSDCMQSVDALDWTRRKTIDANMATQETSVPGVFAAGDAVTGPATVIEAIGGGKRAARAIDRYLSDIPQPKLPPVPTRRGRIEFLPVTASRKMSLKRPHMPLLNVDRRRTTFQQVELGYSQEMVQSEAERCLRCDVCLRCGKCVEVCRDKMGVDALQMGYFDFDHPVQTDFRVTAERCIACGACAANCPTGAMQMEDTTDERILSLCGTVLNRQKLLYCDDCGAVVGPARYLDFVQKRTNTVARVADDRKLCENCTRKSTARLSADKTPVT